MEDIINKLTKDTIQDIKNTEVKKIIIENTEKITPEQRAVIESIKRIKNPFRMIGVKEVMKDLHICETVAYKTFKRADFPSINIGKTNQVMLLAYLIWKMQKRV